MFLLGEAFLCTSFSPPTALPLLLLPGLTEIRAILCSIAQEKRYKEETKGWEEKAKKTESKGQMRATEQEEHSKRKESEKLDKMSCCDDHPLLCVPFVTDVCVCVSVGALTVCPVPGPSLDQ